MTFWTFIYTTPHVYVQLNCTVLCSFIESSSFPCSRPNRFLLFSFFQFDNEYQFNDSVKTLLSRLPKQRYLKSICEELHRFKIMKKYVGCMCYMTRLRDPLRLLCCQGGYVLGPDWFIGGLQY